MPALDYEAYCEAAKILDVEAALFTNPVNYGMLKAEMESLTGANGGKSDEELDRKASKKMLREDAEALAKLRKEKEVKK